nr:uncharacterized protein LOC113820994 [Penaeus vannamei]
MFVFVFNRNLYFAVYCCHPSLHFASLNTSFYRFLTGKVIDLYDQKKSIDFEGALNIADVNSSKKSFKLQLKVDIPVLDSAQDLQKAVPNLHSRYWSLSFKGKRSCAHYPFYDQIRYNKGCWQIFSTSSGTFYLFGAYYDNRTMVDGPIVRVLGMMDRVVQQVSIFCQFWLFGQNKPVFAKVSGHTYIWTTFSHITYRLLRPCLLSCQMPSDYAHQVPESVSLVEQPCDTATTNLRVVNNRPPEGQTKDFAVCVKGLDIYHEDKSIFLVEWLETLYLLGADKVFMYDLQVHPNTAKVLKYYQETGFVDLTKLTLPGDQPNIPELSHHYLNTRILDKLLNELIPYNDCLYRNIYNYKYVVTFILNGNVRTEFCSVPVSRARRPLVAERQPSKSRDRIASLENKIRNNLHACRCTRAQNNHLKTVALTLSLKSKGNKNTLLLSNVYLHAANQKVSLLYHMMAIKIKFNPNNLLIRNVKHIAAGLSKDISPSLSVSVGNTLSKIIGASLSTTITVSLSTNITAKLSPNISARLSTNIGISLSKNIGASLSTNISASMSTNISVSLSRTLVPACPETLVPASPQTLVPHCSQN